MYLKVMLTLLVVLEAAAAAALWHAGRPEPGATYYTDRELAAGLNRRVTLSVTRVNRSEAITKLAVAAGTRISIDLKALDGSYPRVTWAFDDEVSLDLRHAPVSAVLGAMLPDEAGYRALPDGSLEVTSQEIAAGELLVRAYDLKPVLDDWARRRPGGDRAETGARGSR